MNNLHQPNRRIEKLQRELFSTLTHELKTPITTLKLLVHSECNKLRNRHCSESSIIELQFIDRELDRLTGENRLNSCKKVTS